MTTPGAAPLVASFAYDHAGALVAAENADAAVAFERDARGRVVSETVNGRRIESAYDCCGNRTERRIGARLVRYAYDPMGALTELTIGANAPLSLSHDAIGRETRRSSTHGFQLEQRYDDADQLIAQAAGGLSPEPAVRRDYRWNAAYEPVAIADARWGETAYAYDDNSQVVEAKHGDGFVERFGYYKALNIISFSDSGTSPPSPIAQGGARIERASLGASRGAVQPWASSPGGRVIEARGPMRERVGYVHDLLGRVVERRIERDGFRPKRWRYGWDGKSRLVSCDTPGGERWAYGYDPFGRRMWKKRAAGARLRPGGGPRKASLGTAFTWDGDLIGEEALLASDGTPRWDAAISWHFEAGSFRPMAREAADGTVLYIVNDHLGTPREMLDDEGATRLAASYHLWGAMKSVWIADNDNEHGRSPGGRGGFRSNGNLALALEADPGWTSAVSLCPIRFQGQWQDNETGLNYNRFRQYDVLTSQYISKDQVGLYRGLRSFAYVKTPTILVDRYGLAEDMGQLQTMANQVRNAGLSPQNINNRTIAVGMSENGTLYAGSSNGFDAGQRAMLDQLGINRVQGSANLHAEEELMRAQDRGQLVSNLKTIGTDARAPCGPTEHNCAQQMQDRDITAENNRLCCPK